MSDAFEVVDPASTAVEFRGERLEIKPFTIGAAAKVIRVAQPVVAALMEKDIDALGAGDEVLVLLELIAEHADAMFAVAAMAAGKDEAWIRDGSCDEFIQLAAVVFRVNRDFFVKRIAPLLAGLRDAPGIGDGRTRSSSSSSTATPSTTSADTPSANSGHSPVPPSAPADGSSATT